MTPSFAGGRRRQEQRSEIGCLADNVARSVHSIELRRESEPSETAVQPVLSLPGRALVIEIETVSIPDMTDEVMNGAEPIERATELTAEERMKALSNGGG